MHNVRMRNHTDIVKDAGANVVAELTGSPLSTVYSWAQRNSIPADHWLVLVEKGHTTAEELMAGRVKAA
jgi:hypothetical protein